MVIAKKLLETIYKGETAIAVLAFTGIALLLLADVLLREFAGTSISGAQRTSVYAMICTGFLGLSIAAARGRHLRPTFADGLIPKSFQIAASRIGTLIMAITFLIFGGVATGFVIETHEYGDLARVIRIPLWYIQLIVPYAFFSTGLRYALHFLYPQLKPDEE